MRFINLSRATAVSISMTVAGAATADVAGFADDVPGLVVEGEGIDVLEILQLLARDFLADEALDRGDIRAFLGGHQGERVAFRLGKVDGAVQRFEAVKGVSFDIPENSTVALVGESGSGKSVTAMSILNLLPDNAERSGSITLRSRAAGFLN